MASMAKFRGKEPCDSHWLTSTMQRQWAHQPVHVVMRCQGTHAEQPADSALQLWH